MKTLSTMVGTPTTEIVATLQQALAEEFIAWYQYTIIRPFLVGIMRPDVEKFYEEAAEDELKDHAYWIMDRLSYYNATPVVMHGEQWNCIVPDNHKSITPATDTKISVEQMIIAEEGAIETYTKLECISRDVDPVTNSKVKEILADEQEHLQTLHDLLADIMVSINNTQCPDTMQKCPCDCDGCSCGDDCCDGDCRGGIRYDEINF